MIKDEYGKNDTKMQLSNKQREWLKLVQSSKLLRAGTGIGSPEYFDDNGHWNGLKISAWIRTVLSTDIYTETDLAWLRSLRVWWIIQMTGKETRKQKHFL